MMARARSAGSRRRLALPLAILAAAFLLRVMVLPIRGLWYDELLSVTWASLPVRELLRSVQAFDPHPPLYYLQLRGWLLPGAADFWAKYNSVIWSILAAASLYVASRRVFGRVSALWGLAFFALSPFAITYAQEARMYSLLMLLAIWSWYFTHRFLSGQRNVPTALGMVISTELFLYSHGASFMLPVSLAGYAGLHFLLNRSRRLRPYLEYALLLVAVVAACLPWLRRAWGVSVGHTVAPGVRDIAETYYTLVFGSWVVPSAVVQWLPVVLVFVVAVALIVFHRPSRPLIGAFVLIPPAFCLAVSYLVKPVWIYRTLAYTAPFLSLALALAVNEAAARLGRDGGTVRRIRLILGSGTAAILWVLCVGQQVTLTYPHDYRAAADYLKDHARAGDVVVAANARAGWALSWYLAGPGQARPLDAAGQVQAGDGVTVRFSLAQDVPVPQQPFWLVYRESDRLPDIPATARGPVHDFAGLRVERVNVP